MRLDLKNARKALSLGPLFPKMGNPRMEDKVGMGVALVTSHASLRPGKNAWPWHLQWDSMRKTPTWANHAYKAIMGDEGGSIFSSDNKKMYLSEGSCESRWFSAFILGAKKRMGHCNAQYDQCGHYLGIL
uniref:Uncharacterized protein n=1 Tax=Skeletonema marinoi TaxID=267567 RepID=A0A7S2LX02_9STRA|mmetsp:Transcript_30396/g.51688  ORF Transcript_30396/g.51688 Transcript_30396/m.51688 type:complete len:130 (+) Transcript_30396:68-457(+)